MFKKYTSIENTYRDEFLDRIEGHGFWEDEFVVQEKAHGSNLSIYSTNGTDFFTAKRTGPLDPDERFYNHHAVLIELLPTLRKLWADIQSEISSLAQLNLFGELIGGTYPHPEVKKDKNAIRVQKGVAYSPKNHFYAFDILINGRDYMDVDRANAYFEKHGLVHAKTLSRGKIVDCLAYPNDANSLIYRYFNLPEITPNTMEGVVIKPTKTRHFNNGVRVILKNKNEKWSEREKITKRIHVEDPPSEKVVQLQEIILAYVTENRLSNVLSKIGDVTLKDFGKVLGMFNKDIVEDFLKDYEAELADMDKKDVKLVTKSFMKNAADMVKNAF